MFVQLWCLKSMVKYVVFIQIVKRISGLGYIAELGNRTGYRKDRIYRKQKGELRQGAIFIFQRANSVLL